jgi:hypothetical protein
MDSSALQYACSFEIKKFSSLLSPSHSDQNVFNENTDAPTESTTPRRENQVEKNKIF